MFFATSNVFSRQVSRKKEFFEIVIEEPRKGVLFLHYSQTSIFTIPWIYGLKEDFERPVLSCILGAMLDLSYKDLIDQDYGIAKGYFVACEFIKAGVKGLYSWQMRNAELEFLQVTADSEIVPVEVKKGKQNEAKKLYCTVRLGLYC